MDAELARAARAQHAVSLAYVDLDNFKWVNDQQGHAEGNRALSTVAHVIRDELRHTDVIGRVGGDEFAVLLPATDADAARKVLSQVLSRVKAAMTEHRWPITASIGAITCPRPPASADALLRAADGLMYEAKAGGKNAFRHRTWTVAA
jgi:diguanylate cyclase (GGDEF)-like protein